MAKSIELSTMLNALKLRQQYFTFGEENALRLIHDEVPELRCDLYGNTCWFYWFSKKAPKDAELEVLSEFSNLTGASRWLVRQMVNRGKNPHQDLTWSSEEILSWTIEEHGVRYILKADQGLSPGLFLDQRANRKWIMKNSTNCRFLNLFSYTGGFGLCAAKGNAKSVLNVDTSKSTLSWAGENAHLNGLSMDYCAMDAREFLDMSLRQERQFDLIVCDPPSFARTKKKAFRLEKGVEKLAKQVANVLAPGGRAIFSTNFESWDLKEFGRRVQKGVGKGYSIDSTPSLDRDCTGAASLKSLFVTKFG